MSDQLLFTPLQIGPWLLPTRVVMAPLTRNRAPQAVPNALMAQYYAQRANPATGAALIVSEGTAISPSAQGYADVPGLYTAGQVQAWRQVTDAVHAQGGRIVCQLWHVGRVSHSSLQPGGAAPVAPSALPAQARTYVLDTQGQGRFIPTSEPRALAADELPAIVQDYAQAARQAVQGAGFDGVEIHAANGYLLDQFMKSGANQRSDDYGGSLPNRCRLTLEVVRAVAAAIGAERVGIRLSPVAPVNGIDEAAPTPLFDYLMAQLGPLGLGFVHVIEGSTGGPREVPDRPFDFARMKQQYRQAGGQGAWLVNNGYTAETAQAALASGYADAVSFGKGFISMPDLAARMRQGGPYQDADRATLYGGGAQGYVDYAALNS